jgi:signal transduction histidine kinase
MDQILAILDANRIVVQFLYGQAFFIAALAILLRLNRQSRFRLARAIWLFAVFALLHALSEWGEVFIPLQSNSVPLPAVRWLQYLQLILVAASFVVLYQFGASLLIQTRPSYVWLRLLAFPLGAAWLLSLLVGPTLFPARGSDLVELALGTARILLLLPAAALVVSALSLEAGDAELKAFPRISRSLRWTALCLGLWAVVAETGPSLVALTDQRDYLRIEALLVGVAIPAGLGLAYFITRAMEIFGIEQRQRVQAMERRHLVLVERERIAQNLHDGVTQVLYSIGMQAQAGMLRAQDDRTRAAFDAMSGLAQRALEEVRSTVDASLPQPGEGRTFEAALAALPSEYAPLNGPALDVRIRGDRSPLPPAVEGALYRIAREAFFNACRHAGAAHIYVTLEFAPEKVGMRIEDDGLGISDEQRVTALRSRGHFGLSGMVERLAPWHGSLGIHSRPQGGTEVSATIPLGAYAGWTELPEATR